jgi:5-methylcytosine-specific restriction enzyme subunit McrC
MSVTSPQIIELTEYIPKLLPRSLLPDAVGEMLWRDYDTQVSIDFPSPKTGDRWRLTAQGWVGHIPLTSTRERLEQSVFCQSVKILKGV